MNISYLVLYCADPAASAGWFTDSLGLRFTREQHGANRPVHYAATLDDGTVLELYPTGTRPVTRTRIGITVRDTFGVAPAPTAISDPDGNTIEVRAAKG